jgi:hypothetical protein
MYRRPVSIAAVTVFAIGLAACASSIEKKVEDRIDEALEEGVGTQIPSDVDAPGDDLLAAEVVPLMNEFERIVPDPDAVTNVNITVANISIITPQADDPSLVDSYEFGIRVGFRGPKPAQDRGEGPIEARRFALDEVDWAKVPELGATAITEVGVEGAHVSNVTATKGILGTDGQLTVRVFVTGARGSGFVDFTPTGEVLEVSAP